MTKTMRRSCPCCGHLVTNLPEAVGTPAGRTAHPVMAGVGAILRAHNIGGTGATFTSVADRSGTTNQTVARMAHDKHPWTPRTIVIIDRILAVFGFELALRKIPERPTRNRIEPVVNADGG